MSQKCTKKRDACLLIKAIVFGSCPCLHCHVCLDSLIIWAYQKSEYWSKEEEQTVCQGHDSDWVLMPQPENIKKNCFYQVILIITINVCHFAQFKPIQWESTNYYKTWSNISSIRGSVSSPHETLRRQLKIWLQWSIFDELWGVSSGDETLCRNMLVITSHTKWF